MPDPIETTLAAALKERTSIGEVLIRQTANHAFMLHHREDDSGGDLKDFHKPEDAIDIARFDDAGNYRPLKTAPNLRHGWRLTLIDLKQLRQAVEHFYPGRLAVLAASQQSRNQDDHA